jgi:hypothetical protein
MFAFLARRMEGRNIHAPDRKKEESAKFKTKKTRDLYKTRAFVSSPQ